MYQLLGFMTDPTEQVMTHGCSAPKQIEKGHWWATTTLAAQRPPTDERICCARDGVHWQSSCSSFQAVDKTGVLRC